jgi:hypothetical protein
MKEFFEMTNKNRVSYKNAGCVKKLLLTENLRKEKMTNIEVKMKVFNNIYKKQQKRFDKIKNNIDNSLKTFYSKSYKKLNNNNSKIAELATTRETFVSKFNIHKESEMGLLNILKLENESTNINQIIEYYNGLKRNGIKTDNLNKIHRIISNRKEKIILNDIQNYGFDNRGLMLKHYEDYKLNNWDINYTTIKKLKAFIE